MCPVQSFKMYPSHLNPENPFLWQTPNYKPKYGTPKGFLARIPFVTDFSKKCKLFEFYTNHCIRITGTSIHVNGFSHIWSLTVNQHVQNKKKMEMGRVLLCTLTTTDEDLPKRNNARIHCSDNNYND